MQKFIPQIRVQSVPVYSYYAASLVYCVANTFHGIYEDNTAMAQRPQHSREISAW